MKRVVARWEAKGGKRFIELFEENSVYGYTGDGCGGNIGFFGNDDAAIARMEHPSYGAVTCLKADFPSTKRIS